MRLTKADKEMVKRFKSASALLEKFDLQLIGFDPGVTCKMLTFSSSYVSQPLTFGHEEWRWLEPILQAHLKLKGFRVRGRR